VGLLVALAWVALGGADAFALDQQVLPLPDSPPFYSYSYNTYTELGWHEVEIAEHRGIAGWSVEYTWHTLDSFMGTFYAQSPDGTVFTIGFAEDAGSYLKPTDKFDDQWTDGTWIFWVEDVSGFGEQRATDITVTIDLVDTDTPFGLVAETHGTSALLAWKDAVESVGLLGYRIYRNGWPIAEVAATPASYADDGLALGTYCYVVAALYDSGEAGSTNEDCTTIYPPGVYGLPDSPTDPFRYHSYQELGWTDLPVIDRGIVEGWSIDFTWDNVNGYTDGSLHAESPSGTLLTLGTGLTDGEHTIPTAAFDGEASHGNWRIWIEDDDTFGDGQYRVTDATVTLAVDRTVPTDLEATREAAGIVVTWVAPQEGPGLTGYNLYRDDTTPPVGSVPAGTTTYTDTDIPAGTTLCYLVAADYGTHEQFWPFPACAGAPGVYPIPDSPPPNQPNTYYCDSYLEAGWIDVPVTDPGPIFGWRIDYDWATNWAEMGLFYARSPSGTQVTVAEDQPAGHYTFDSSAFDGESALGNWRLWIVDDDFFCDGMHRATGITMTVDLDGSSMSPGVVPPTLRLERLDASTVRFYWEASPCGPAEDYGIYAGTLGVWDSHRRVDCSDAGGDLQEDLEPRAGNRYYLVVPHGGGYVGSFGTDSNGNERPVGGAACAPSQMLGCP